MPVVLFCTWGTLWTLGGIWIGLVSATVFQQGVAIAALLVATVSFAAAALLHRQGRLHKGTKDLLTVVALRLPNPGD